MCPKLKGGICEIVGIKPEYVGVCIWESCFKKSAYESCNLYMVELLFNSLNKSLIHRKEAA